MNIEHSLSLPPPSSLYLSLIVPRDDIGRDIEKYDPLPPPIT